MKIKTLILFLFTVIITGCYNHDFKYDTIISDSPVNLEKLNSAYDDFNSDLPYMAGRFEIIFSTNRDSKGEHFDIVGVPINVTYHDEDDKLDFNFDQKDDTSFQDRKMFSLTNTPYDELGPYSYLDPHGMRYLFYANNEDGNFDIKIVFTDRGDWGVYKAKQRVYGPSNSNLTNSASDDLYPTIDKSSSKLLFCSNRESKLFNIYEIYLDPEEYLYKYLVINDSVPVIKNTILSSDANDKCPSVKNDLLVFSSDRKGGFGGYDLYYSARINNEWSSPINFGSEINTEYDEYRPVTFKVLRLFDLMIFSSNRPKGKGGFDLFCVKIDNLIK